MPWSLAYNEVLTPCSKSLALDSWSLTADLPFKGLELLLLLVNLLPLPPVSLSADAASFGEKEEEAEAAAKEAGRGEKPGKPKEGGGRDEEEGGRAESEEDEGRKEGGGERGGGRGGEEGEETENDPRLTASSQLNLDSSLCAPMLDLVPNLGKKVTAPLLRVTCLE